jgi:hypothetical protein
MKVAVGRLVDVGDNIRQFDTSRRRAQRGHSR